MGLNQEEVLKQVEANASAGMITSVGVEEILGKRIAFQMYREAEESEEHTQILLATHKKAYPDIALSMGDKIYHPDGTVEKISEEMVVAIKEVTEHALIMDLNGK